METRAISVVPSLEDQGISVTNPEPTSGGRLEQTPRVTPADYDAAAADIQNRLAGALAAYLRDPANVPDGLTLFPDTAEPGPVSHPSGSDGVDRLRRCRVHAARIPGGDRPGRRWQPRGAGRPSTTGSCGTAGPGVARGSSTHRCRSGQGGRPANRVRQRGSWGGHTASRCRRDDRANRWSADFRGSSHTGAHRPDHRHRLARIPG